MALGFALLSLFFLHRLSKARRLRPVDLIHDDGGTDVHESPISGAYSARPFMIQSPDSVGVASSITPLGQVPMEDDSLDSSYPSTPNSGSRKVGKLSPPRKKVRVVQHEDAGPERGSDGEDSGEAESVVELPPAYHNVGTHTSHTSVGST